MIPKLSFDSFDWQRWRKFDLFLEKEIACRSQSLIRNAKTLQKYAVGYIKAEKIRCRPKKDCIALMFLFQDEYMWCHLTLNEFKAIFKDEI